MSNFPNTVPSTRLVWYLSSIALHKFCTEMTKYDVVYIELDIYY